MGDWGFNGPTLDDVIAIHHTYNTANIYFKSAGAANMAQQLTGWGKWDDNALSMQFHDDLLVTHEYNGECFYGDWEIQSQTPFGEEV